jgi:hypothetical protein
VIDGGDVEDIVRLLRNKGYGFPPSQQLLLLCNPQESEAVQTWRSGKESRPGGPAAKHDFVASAVAPPYLSGRPLWVQPVLGEFHAVPVLEGATATLG